MRLTFALMALIGAPAVAQERPELVIYTYESFVSEWGPGPAIAENFEAVCDCTVRFVGAGDGAALIGRLKLEGERTPADVVLGLDTNLTAQAKADGLVVPHSVAAHPALDYSNTRAGWGAAAPKEYLHTLDHLAIGARENGLLTPTAARATRRAGRADPAAAGAVVDRAIALRSALYDCAACAAPRRPCRRRPSGSSAAPASGARGAGRDGSGRSRRGAWPSRSSGPSS